MQPDRDKPPSLDDIVDAAVAGTPAAWLDWGASLPPDHNVLAPQLRLIAEVAAAHQFRQSKVRSNKTAQDGGAGLNWGPLEVAEKIGEGAFGTVHRARDRRLDREVAVKFYRPGSIGSAAAPSDFVEEGRLLALVQHPNVVTVYGAAEFDGKVGIWMELIEGSTLESILAEQGTLSATATAQIGLDLCRALTALHAADVLHRDIKARNVMRDVRGRTVLMDLGVGCSMDRRLPIYVYGTPLYAAPEVLLAGETSPRSDVYSVGVLLYYLVTGFYPVFGADLAELCKAHLKRNYRFLKNVRHELPDAFVRIVEQATAPLPEHRFATADEFAQAIAWALGTETADPLIRRSESPSLAVLPLHDLTPARDHGPLTSGLAEELINALVKIDDLKVAAHTSTLHLMSRGLSVRQIGMRLNVKSVLDGSVRQADGRFRVAVRLSSVADGFPFWSETFDCEPAGLFTMQENVAQAIVDNLRVEILGNRQGRLVKRHTDDVSAYNLYLQGRYYYSRRYEGGLETALVYFEKAIARDPEFALPYLGIADTLNIIGYFDILPPHESFPQAKRAARKALAIDPSLGAAYASLGWCGLFHDWDFPAAERDFRRCIDLDPRWPTGHAWYAMYLAAMGRCDEAVAEAGLAVALDPLNPVVAAIEGVVHFLGRRCGQAIAILQRAVAVHPDSPQIRSELGHALAYAGRYAEAERQLLQALEECPDFPYACYVLGWCYARSGRQRQALEVLARLEALATTRYIAPHNFHVIYLGLGRTEEAFAYLERSYDERDPTCAWYGVAKEADPVRADPRYRSLLRKIGFPD